MCSNRTRVGIVVLTLALLAFAAMAIAQVPPLPAENHYKVYMSSPITLVRGVALEDQFGVILDSMFVFDRFANPVEKRHLDGSVYPILRPEVHMDWWRFRAPQPARTVIAIDQFGGSSWVLGDAVYLLTPSVKYPMPPFQAPVNNHYVCYEALSGFVPSKVVYLIDQWGNAQVMVLTPKYFCNPAEKRTGGEVYPILDHQAHLTCYFVQNPMIEPHSITTYDQFGFWQTETFENNCLCVPALKEHPIRTEQSTWGKIKSLYRN